MKIFIADDHALFRQGLTILLQQLVEVESVTEACNGLQILELLDQVQPDLILMDIDMPGLNGQDTVRAIRQQKKQVPIVALSISARPYDIVNMYDAGINGYLLKSCSMQELRTALGQIQLGKEYYCNEVRQQLFEILLSRRPGNAEEALTAREKEVLIMICKEYSTEEIAQQLYVSPLTINNHRRNILRKTGSKNVAGLVLYALEKNIYSR